MQLSYAMHNLNAWLPFTKCKYEHVLLVAVTDPGTHPKDLKWVVQKEFRR